MTTRHQVPGTNSRGIGGGGAGREGVLFIYSTNSDSDVMPTLKKLLVWWGTRHKYDLIELYEK